MTSIFLGLAVAVAGFFCIVAAALMGQYPALEGYRWHTVGLFGLLSICVGVVWLRAARAARSGLQDQAASGRVELLRNWCVMLAVLGVISIFLQPLRGFKKTTPVAVVATPKPPPPRPTPPPTAPAPAPAPVITFREVKIQGILFQANKRLVIIEGDAYSEGEMIYDLRIKSVQRNGVVMEKAGKEKFITFN